MSRPIRTNARYLTVLAAAAALILVVGGLLRPRPRLEEQPPPSETDIARLTRLTQRRSLENLSAYFSTLATESMPYLVGLADEDLSGVVWDAHGTIASTRLTARHSQTSHLITADGQTVLADVDWAPASPIVAVHMQATTLPPRRAATLPRPGDWILAMWKTRENTPVFVPTNFLQTLTGSCSGTPVQEISTPVMFTRAMAGGGLFDLDGNLLGLITACDGRYAAISAASVDILLKDATSLSSRLLVRYGLVLGTPSAAEAEHFGVAGSSPRVLVREVWSADGVWFSPLRPGDIIDGVNGANVTGINDLQPLVSAPAGTAPRLVVSRRGSAMDVLLDDSRRGDATATTPAAGALTAEDGETAGFPVAELLEAARLTATGIERDDRVVRIDGVAPVSRPDARRLLTRARTQSVYLEVAREGRLRGVLIGSGER